MLIDQKDADILSLRCELVESSFDSSVVGLGIDNKEVLLRIRCWRDMLHGTIS